MYRLLPVLAFFVLFTIHPFMTHAAAATFTANEVVPNTLGTNDQTVATSSTQANVAQTKATRTITVNSVPAAPIVLTIGTCAITITSSVASDVDCSNNTAAIATSTDTTAALIAARIRTITGLSDTGHGALTIGGSSATASFTTTGTETSATPITATLSSGTDVTLTTVNTTGVIPVAQVWTYTPANVEAGDVFTAIINGTTVSFTATASTVANVTAGLTAAINASAQSSAVTATDQTTRIDVTSDVAGTAFTLTKGTTNGAALQQEVTFTPANVTGYKFTLTLDGSSYTYGAYSSADTVLRVVAGLNDQVEDDAVTCTEDGAMITCTANVGGTPFTYAAEVEAQRGGGGGSSHHSSSSSSGSGSSSSSVTSHATVTTTMPVKTVTTTAAASTSFSRDLTTGATGADVMALQVWLNAHGFPIAATGVGSKGMETTYFGGLTQAALAKWQASVGITPSAGYFGPKTRAYLASH